MILEDDALFNSDMELKRDIAIDTIELMGKNWDILYLGRHPIKPHLEERLTETIVIPEFSYCAHSYCVSPKGIKRLLGYNLQKSIIPLDEFLPATYVEHPRMDVSLIYPPSLIVYAMDPVIVKQRPKAEVGSDTGLPEVLTPVWRPK
jgi:GR25 family glycosyltransferase involved in LPS biosynthesis